MSILLIEADTEPRATVTTLLHTAGYLVDTIRGSRPDLPTLARSRYEAVIVNPACEDLDALEMVRSARKYFRGTPIVLLKSINNLDERMAAYEAGADECLDKPLVAEEFIVRLRVLTRRNVAAATLLIAGSIVMDLVNQTASRRGRPIELSTQEFRLLQYLVQHADKAISRKALLGNVWNIHFDPHTTVVESRVSRLRAALNKGFEHDVIQTVRGVGYRLLLED
jgi:two-component system OmpR family response regulator